MDDKIIEEGNPTFGISEAQSQIMEMLAPEEEKAEQPDEAIDEFSSEEEGEVSEDEELEEEQAQSRAGELLLFKQFDSANERSCRMLHTAVHHPDTPDEAPPRRSVEVRLLCLHPKEPDSEAVAT